MGYDRRLNSKVEKKYVMTCGINSITPTNHGLIDITEEGIILESGDPIEDFGMFYISDKPFPENDKDMLDIFIALMDDAEPIWY